MEFGLKGDVQVLPFAVDQTQQQVIHVVCHLCLGLLESGDGGNAVLQGFHAVKTDNGDILSGRSAGIADCPDSRRRRDIHSRADSGNFRMQC